MIAPPLPAEAAPATPAAPGADAAPSPTAAAAAADPAAAFLPLLLQQPAAGVVAAKAADLPPPAPPGDGKPRAKGARTAQSEGADKTTDTDDSAGPVATAVAAAALLTVSLPVPTSGAPTHTDDAPEPGAEVPKAGSAGHADAVLPSDEVRALMLAAAGPAGRAPAAAAQVGDPRPPRVAAPAVRLAADPADGTAAPTHAPAASIVGQTDAARPETPDAAGVPGEQPGGSEGAGETMFPPLAPLLASAPGGGRPAPARAGRGGEQSSVAAIAAAKAAKNAKDSLHAAATRALAAAAPAAPAVDPTAAPAQPQDSSSSAGSTPTAHAQLPELPDAAAALLEVATAARATRARIVLTPPELGKVEIRLRYTDSGVSATFHTDSPQAVQSLAAAGGDLRRSLEAQGIQVSTIDVPFVAAGGGDQGAAWLGGGNADPQFAQTRGGGSAFGGGAGAAATSFEPDDQTTLRTVLLGTAVDVLA